MLVDGKFVTLQEEASGDTTPAGGGGVVESVPAELPATELDLKEIVDSDLGDEDIQTPAVVDVKPAVVKPVAVTPLITKPSEDKPAVAPVVSPVTTPVVVSPITTAQSAESETSVVAPVESAASADFATLRAQQVDRLAQAYGLSEEDTRLMLVEPEKVLPKLAARLHVDVFEAAFNAIVSALPRLIDTHSQARADRDAARDQFYTEFPSLKDPKYDGAVQTALTMFRHMNPSATRAQAIAAAGVQASLTHQLALPERYMRGFAPTAAPASPASFSPASPGAASVPNVKGPSSFFEKIAEEDILDR